MNLEAKKKSFLKYLEREEFEICYTGLATGGLVFNTCKVSEYKNDDSNAREVYLWDIKNAEWLKINVGSIIYIKFKTSDEILKLEETERIVKEQLELPINITDSLSSTEDWWIWVMGQRKEWLKKEEELEKSHNDRIKKSRKEIKSAISKVRADTSWSYGSEL